MAERLRQEVERGKPSRVGNLDRNLALPLSINGIWLGILASTVASLLDLNTAAAIVLGVGVGVLFTAAMLTLSYLNIKLEFLPESEQPRHVRFRRKGLAIFGSLLVGVVAGLIVAVILGS